MQLKPAPTLIFLNRLGMFSSSKGSEPQSRAYKMTPQDQTSTSGPAYSRPEMTCRGGRGSSGPVRGVYGRRGMMRARKAVPPLCGRWFSRTQSRRP